MSSATGSSPLSGIIATTEVITPGQLATAAFTLTLCGTLFLFPGASIETGGRSGWLLAFPAIVYAILTGLIVISTVRAVPGQLFPDMLLQLLGSTWGRSLAAAMAVLLMTNAAIDYRLAVEPVQSVFFVHTPLWVIVALLAIPSIYLAWTGPVRMSRLYPLLASMILAGFVITFFIGSSHWDYGYLLPLQQLDQISGGTNLWACLFMFRTAFGLAFLLPYYPPKPSALRPYITGVVVGGLILATAAAVPVAAFGPWGARDVVRPFMEAIGTITIPNSPLTRIEFLIRLLFQSNVIAALALQTYAAASLLSRAFNIEDNIAVILMAGLPPVVTASWFASDFQALSLIKPGIALGSLMFTVIFLFLWVMSRFRKGEGIAAPPEDQERAAD